MSAKHTLEPRKFGHLKWTASAPILSENGYTFTIIAEGISSPSGGPERIHEESTRRMVASVNACAGIPTEALEAGVVGEMLEALESIATIVLRPFPAPEAEARRVNEAVETALNVLAKARGESP